MMQGKPAMTAEKNKGGRPPHQPTDETRAQARALIVAGINQPEIARIIGISEPTLVKHYAEELAVGLDKTIANVANTLVQKALNGDTASIIFFLKVRGKKYGWSERLEVTGQDGGPMQHEHTLSDEAAANLDAIAARLAGSAGAAGVAGKGEA